MAESATLEKGRTAKDWKQSPVASHHHITFRCKDPEETRAYYEDFLGLEFCAATPITVEVDGKPTEALRMMFRMSNGDFINFEHIPDRNGPFELGPLDMHFALKVASEEEWKVCVGRLDKEKIHYEGPLDHDFVRSVYFQDPNGIWLEYTYIAPDHDEQMVDLESHARPHMAGWTTQTADTKNKARGK